MNIHIEVAYADQTSQCIIKVQLKKGSTIEDAIAQSGIALFCPKIDLTNQKVGIFGKQKKLTDLVKEGDRVEIYRPLLIDPKTARLNRQKNKGR